MCLGVCTVETIRAGQLTVRTQDMTSHQTASDAVRLGVLSRYGGVWLDVARLDIGACARWTDSAMTAS